MQNEVKAHSSLINRVDWAHPSFGHLFAACLHNDNVAIFQEIVGEDKQKMWTMKCPFTLPSPSPNDIAFSPSFMGLNIVSYPEGCNMQAICFKDGSVNIYRPQDVFQLWSWQKKSDGIADLVSHVWEEWAGEDGTIGKAYGYQLGIKHQYKEGMFDQVDRVLYDLKHNPASRPILTNIYNFEDLHEMNLYPCAYSMTFNVTGDRLNAILNQRSQDMLTANNWNVVQYAVLTHMMAQVSGLKVGELVHVIADCHIYDRHIPAVKAMLELDGYEAPKFSMDESITDFYAFTKDSFRLENYQYHPFDFEIPMAI